MQDKTSRELMFYYKCFIIATTMLFTFLFGVMCGISHGSEIDKAYQEVKESLTTGVTVEMVDIPTFTKEEREAIIKMQEELKEVVTAYENRPK